MKRRERERRLEELKAWMAAKRKWNKEHPVEVQEKRWANLLLKEKKILSRREMEELRQEKKQAKKKLRVEKKRKQLLMRSSLMPEKKAKNGFFRRLKDRYDHLIKTKLKAGR